MSSGKHDFDNFKAVGNVIIAERLSGDDATPGGILIPETARKSKPWWKVIGVGPRCENGIKVGDRVVFRDGYTVEHEGRVAAFLYPEQVMATLPAPEPK